MANPQPILEPAGSGNRKEASRFWRTLNPFWSQREATRLDLWERHYEKQVSYAVLFDDGDQDEAVPEQYISKQGVGPLQVGDKVTITWPSKYRGENHPAIIKEIKRYRSMKSKLFKEEIVNKHVFVIVVT